MNEGPGDSAVENFTAFVKSKLPPVPTSYEVNENGPVAVVSTHSSSSPPSPVQSTPLPPLRSTGELSAARSHPPRQDSVLSDPTSSGVPAARQRTAPPSAVRERNDAGPLPTIITTTVATAYANSSISTTGTDCYPSTGPLLRRVERGSDRQSPLRQQQQQQQQQDQQQQLASSLTSPHASPRPPSMPNDEEQEELPHLHDFLLRASTSCASTTAATKLDALSDPTPSVPFLHNDNSSTQPPVKGEDSLPQQPSANEGFSHVPQQQQLLPPSPPSRQASPTTATPQAPVTAATTTTAATTAAAGLPDSHASPSHDTVQKLRNQDPHQQPDVTPSQTDSAGLPMRLMVRRSPVTAAPERRVAATVTVHESAQGALVAGTHTTAEQQRSQAQPQHVASPPPDRSDTTRSWDVGSPGTSGDVPATATKPRTPVDLLTPSFHGNAYADIDAAAHAASVAAGLTPDLPIRETFPIPRYCPDDLLRGEDKLWCPGKPLRIAYVTWNMANKTPRMDEVSAYCIHPNAHLVVVGTQENGPYVGTNTLQNRWAKTVGEVCLGGQYELVGKEHMWAIQMLVFARKRDVAKYVSRAHASHVSTGMLCGWGGNKGGVAVGLVLSLTPKFVEISHAATTQRAVTTAPPTPRGERLSATAGAESSTKHPNANGVGVGHKVSGDYPCCSGGGGGMKVTLPKVLRTDDGNTVSAGGGVAGQDGTTVTTTTDDVALSPSAIAGPSPPALLSASVMQHDVDDDDADDVANARYHHRLQGQSSTYSAGGEEEVHHHNGNTHHEHNVHDIRHGHLHPNGLHEEGGVDGDSVFSPAEMISRNASFDLSRERQRRQKQKRSLRHSFKRKDRGYHTNSGGISSGSATKHNRRRKHNSTGHYADIDHHHHHHGVNEEQDSDGAGSAGTPDGDTPNYMTLLFITAHLAAHQGAVINRNKDYREIVHGLQLGRRGPHKKFFKRLLKRRRVLDNVEGEDGEGSDADKDHWDDDSSEDDVTPLRLPVVSAIVNHNKKTRRDVTEEFDLTFFGGDLNYRINGTRKAIEYVIQHHRNIRSILINNDQLSLERARGTVFQGYQEGNLLFRPTYKYEVSNTNGGVTLDAYNFSRKKDRMPAYCDRVLFKKKLSSAARRVAIRLYTDVPNVRTSDHRPVVALFDVGTRAYTG